MIKIIKNFFSKNTGFLIRLDDVAENMQWEFMEKTEELFDKFRDNYFSPEMCAGYNWHKKVVDEHDKVFVTPYLTESVKEFFYSKRWDEVNKPFQKHHVRNSFDEFKRVGKIKNHLNLQIDMTGIMSSFLINILLKVYYLQYISKEN